MKKKVGVILGGISVEHEISVLSAMSIIESLHPHLYEPVPIGVSKKGEWFFIDWLKFKDHVERETVVDTTKERFALEKILHWQELPLHVDVIFPILHGTFGEDGVIQGLLKCLNIPFVGAGVLGSSVGMDKEITKRILQSASIPIAKFHVVNKSDVFNVDDIMKEFEFPVFVKPANAGSSIGVTKCKNKEQLKNAIEHALRYDHKALVEEFIEGREIECSVLGGFQPIASLPGEVFAHHEFYTYEAKYFDESGASFAFPAELTLDEQKMIQDLSIKVFKLTGCFGLARVDFFLKNGKAYVNEINTLPGFTKRSPYPKLFEISGVPRPELVHRLIELAFEKHALDKALEVSYTRC